jgi:hypothetical protein
MKNIPVMVIVVLGVAFTGLAHADPKKQRKQNRVGPYAAIHAGFTEYSGDHDANGQALLDFFTNNGIPYQNVVTHTDDTDLSYQISFGYRFNRYIAAELALCDYGSLVTTTQADVLIPNSPGYAPSNNKLGFKFAGPLFSVIGILPINNSFELYGRLGYIFASTTRDLNWVVEGAGSIGGSAHSDAQRPVYGVGMNFNLGQVYTIRAEYERITNIGQSQGLFNEDIQAAHLGFAMRF